MTQINSIPIKNIFHMLLYAWNKIWESSLVNVAELDECKNIEHLLTRVLLNSAKSIFKRGLDQGYVGYSGGLQQLRGRVNFGKSMQAISHRNLTLECDYEVFDFDILQNQILKSTIERLLRLSDVKFSAGMISELEFFYLRMKRISSVQISDSLFRNVQLHSNNGAYRLLLDVCRLINRNMLISEDSGQVKFLNFAENARQMHELFEDFLKNFFKLRQKTFAVRSQKLWLSENPADIMPEMHTDITLENSDRVIIVDAKFYQDIFQTTRFGKRTLRNAHLNQLHAYLSAYEQVYKKKAEGMLIYAEGKSSVNHKEQVLGYTHAYRSIDLSQDWQAIETDLLSLIN